MDFRFVIRRQAWLRLLGSVLLCLLLFAAAMMTSVRMDWTEDQVYSLSDSTLHVLESMDEPVLIRAYVSEGMPQPYGRLRQFIADMLTSYHEAGGGNVDYELLNPDADSTIAATLQALNIPKVQVRVIEDDQAQIKQGYMAIVIEYLDKKEIIPVVQSESGMEYLITRKIRKLTGVGRKKIAVASGYGAYPVSQLKRFAQTILEDYELVDVNPAEQAIPDDVSVLVMAGVEQLPSESWRYRTDQFLMQGKGVLLLAGNAKPDLQYGFNVKTVDPYAMDWLRKDWGVSMESGLVMDQRATRVTVNRQQGMYTFTSQVDYPFVPQVVTFSQESIVSRGLEALPLPFPSPLNVPEGATPLLYSSDYAAVQNGPPFDVNPLLSIPQRFSGLQLRPSTLAWSKSGQMNSAFDAIPESLMQAKGEQGDESAPEQPQHRASTNHASLVVASSPALLNDEFYDGATAVFVLNALDWLSGDEALIDLRSRGVSNRPLEQLDASDRELFKFFWMFGPAILLIILGIARWRWLKRRPTGLVGGVPA